MPQAHSPAARRLLAAGSNARRYSRGGMVRGPGTSTSDSIPARLSDGEFVLPADTVKRVGARTLRDLVDATHTPTGNPERRGHFSDGGLARKAKQDFVGEALAGMEQQRAASIAKGNEDAARAAAEAEAAASRAAGSSTAGPSTQASSPAAAPTTGGSLDSRVAQIPVGGPQAPAADGSRGSWSNTEIGRNVNNALMALPGAGAVPAIAKTGGAISSGINAATRLLNAGANAAVGGSALTEATKTLAADASSARATPAASPLVAQPNPTGERLATDTQRLPLGPSNAASPASAPTAREIRPGVYQHGRGQFSDNPDGMGFAPGAGNPSANNIAAADALAARSAADVSGAVARSMQQPQAPQLSIMGGGGFGLRDTDYLARRNAEVSASSMTNARDRNPRTGMSPAETALANIYAMQSAQQRARSDQALQAARVAGDLTRAGIQEQGANARNALDNSTRSLSDLAKIDVDRGRFELEKNAASFQNRTAQRIEGAQTALDNAKTPEEQRNARQRLLALMGKSSEDSWKPVALQGGADAQGNKTESILGAVNERTGEMRRMNQAAPPAAPPADGTQVRGKDGRLYVVKNGQPVLMGG